MSTMRPPLTHTELSSMTGFMSVSCWIIVMSAPVWENYVLKSGEGLSLGFILLWLAGDVTNLIGAALAGLLPTMIILAVYYTICDFILLFQMYYYAQMAKRRAEAAAERAPLLEQPEPKTVKPLLPAYLSYPLLVLFVIVSGWAAWMLSTPEDPSIPEKGGVELEWRSQLLGYASAILYMFSRVPQIAHNYKTRCEGLSLAMFCFSMAGNVTYIASILFKSMEPQYLLTNASWIAGAAVTIFLDLFVLGQFAYFSWQDGQKASVFADDDTTDSDEA